MNRYKTLDYNSLSDVELEIKTMLSIVDLDKITDDELEYISSLMAVAKALGSTLEM